MDFITEVLVFGSPIIAMAIYYFAFYNKPNDDYWRKLPTLPEYLALHPECITDDDENARCCHCHSDKVIFQPLTCHSDPRYKHFCLSCKRELFRSKSIL
ncbi:hypothetical protein [Motilimonas sp. E26]|uniref:hypothetical protein n=1 Tax=Motilimonas sp. E26 TaxID=2865674 RepID=UPI001E4D6104|nr:hypothetical protein [Motilimonas sp. E26]MCE0557697.1 hypothetical protein [Motilimonas sp. E26]